MNHDIISEEEAIAEERTADMQRLGAIIVRRPIRGLPTLRDPICVPREATIRKVVETMNENRVGCVLVVEEGRLVGVFTERDVLTKVVLKGLDVQRTRVDELMTPDPEHLTLNDGIGYALNRMSVGGFRHIPLVDEQGHPTGLVAMRAIVDYLVDLFPADVLNLPPNPKLAFASSREGA